MQLKEEGWVLRGGMIGSRETSHWLMADASLTAIGGFCRTSSRRSYRRAHQTKPRSKPFSSEGGTSGNMGLAARGGGTFNICVRFMFVSNYALSNYM